MKKVVLFIFVFALYSCRSTKRIENTYLDKKVEVGKDNSITTTFKTTSNDVTEIVEETIVESTQFIKSDDGQTIQAPITTTTRKKKIIDKSTNKVDNVQKVDVQNNVTTTKDSTVFLRETEGQEIVGQIAEGASRGLFRSIFGNTVGYIITFFVIVIGILITRKLLKNVNNTKSS
jgi:hypothetical protein